MSLKQRVNLLPDIKNNTSNSNGGIFPVRVKSIIMDSSHPEFKNKGEWSSLGCIFWSDISNPTPQGDITSDNFAYPLLPNIKNYPLLEEITYLIALPNPDIGSSPNSIRYYYFNPLNIWNSIHHNGYPSFTNNTLPESQQKDYQQVEGGSVRRVTDNSTELNLGKTFKENISTKSLLPYEGDIIYEGRFGNSIRFSSTVSNPEIQNQWSNEGNDGDPILIIRNSKYNDGKEAWIPQNEDVNLDDSIIYLTSNQKLPINVSSKSYTSYSTPPIFPSEYQGKQIIINSDRILINSKEDSILLSSKKSVNLNSVESVNIDSPKTIISSKDIKLGDKNATESVILGDSFLNDFKLLLTDLIGLSSVLNTVGTPIPGQPNVAVTAASQLLNKRAAQILSKIDSFKSKTSKTI
jgi:hypothetical protein